MHRIKVLFLAFISILLLTGATLVPLQPMSTSPQLRRAYAATALVEACGVDPDTGRRGKWHGTAWATHEAGLFVTCYHVTEGATSITLELRDGRKATAHFIEGVKADDIAVVRVDEGQEFTTPLLTIARVDAELGTPVFAVGCPLGKPGITFWGHVGGDTPRDVSPGDPVSAVNVIIDFPMVGGCSGSAIIDENTGEVVGVGRAGYNTTHIGLASSVYQLRHLTSIFAVR